MTTIEITSDLISDDLVTSITTFVKSELAIHKRRAVAMDEIQKKFGKETDLQAYQFKLALSKCVAEKRLSGLAMKMGKAGGIGIDDGTIPKPRAPRGSKKKSDIAPIVRKKAAPAIVTNTDDVTDISIGTKQYALSMSESAIEELFVPVFDLESNDDGDIVIGSKKFSAKDQSAIQFIENCIWYMIKNSAKSSSSDDEEEDMEMDEESEDLLQTGTD